VLAKLREHREEVATAAPVWNELLFGCARLPPSRKREALESYLLRTVPIAKVNGLVLVTSDRFHLDAFEGLQVQDWKV
jgi:predicted nucleic acid-binding protein